MRLLNVHDLRFREFHAKDIPLYATASHRWAKDGETTFEDVQERRNTQKTGYRKVECFAKYVREHIPHVEYVWIDTCCIKKESSNEVSEAINSMFRWYSNAEVCLAYLADVKASDDIRGFSQSEWFGRGWTLQELLAPHLVIFLSQDWQVIGYKGGSGCGRSGAPLRAGHALEGTISRVTRVPGAVLRAYGQSKALTVKQRLSWTASRETTREEDMSYSLLGLFGVSMPVIYGEGAAQARKRLFQQIHENAILAGQQPDTSIPDTTLYHVEATPTSSSRVVRQLLDELEPQGVANYRIPFDINGVPATDHFVPRDDEMQQLESFFQHKPLPARRSVFVVHGLGGVGKTQLCVEFVRRHRDDFSAILWLDGSSKDALRQSLADVALRLPTIPATALSSPSQENVDPTSTVLQWLSIPDNSHWLLVFDNVDRDWKTVPKDPQAYDFERFLPPADHGSVLITSRISRLQRPKASLHLQSVNDRLGREILETRAGRRLPDVEDLLEKLGGLPLALVQAGSYLRETNLGIQEYLKFYSEMWESLMALQNQFPLREYAERSVLTTWKMSYEQVNIVDPRAARLLDLWAFLYPGDLWYELAAASTDAIRQAHDDITVIAEDELSFRHSLSVLSQYSLIQANVDRGGFSVHPVVHAWSLQNITSVEARQRFYSYALFSVAKFTPSFVQANSWSVARRLVPHARAIAVRHLALPNDHVLGKRLHNVANFLSDWESSTEAENLYLRALDVKEKVWGPEHTSTLNTVHSLGLLYTDQGKLAEAEEMYMRALKGKEKVLGPEHTSTLDTVDNLGGLYSDQGKLTQAEEMYMRALKGTEKALGPDHTSTLDTVNNIGLLYKGQGKLALAEEMYMRALRGYEKAGRSDHKSTLNTVNNLGNLYKDQGKLAQAEEMYMRALKGKEKAWGPEHTLTLDTVDNLGGLYADQVQLAKSEEMYMRALKGKENALGPEHTSTLDTINNIGILYKDQGKLAQAEEMYTRALRGYEKAGRSNHISALNTINNLGNLYRDQGKLVQAEEMYMQALKGKEKTLGPEHASTLDTFDNLGGLYTDQGKLAQAEEMYMRAWKGTEKILGPEHVSTLDTINNIGLLYKEQGKLAKAEEMYIRALRGYEKAGRLDHKSTLNTINNLGDLYRDQGKLVKAEEMYRRALKRREKAWGPEHVSTLNAIDNLGGLYADQGKLAQSEEMYVQALRGKEKALGPKHTSTLDTANNLGNLYADQGKLAQAEKMYIRALRGYEKAGRPEHTSTLNTIDNLGNIYKDQGKLAHAEEMYIRALKGKEKALGEDHPSTLDTVNDLGVLYKEQGKLAKAEKMYVRALRGYEKAGRLKHKPTLNTINNLGNLYKDQGKLLEAEEMYRRALKHENAKGQSSKSKGPNTLRQFFRKG